MPREGRNGYSVTNFTYCGPLKIARIWVGDVLPKLDPFIGRRVILIYTKDDILVCEITTAEIYSLDPDESNLKTNDPIMSFSCLP